MFLFSLSREAMEKFWEGKRIKHQGKEGSSSSSGERIKEKVRMGERQEGLGCVVIERTMMIPISGGV